MELTELEQKYVELGVEIQRLKSQQEKIGYKDDPIFLLSAEEYEGYKDKISVNSNLNPLKNGWWWLRSPGCNRSHSAVVNGFGAVFCTGHYVYDVFGAVYPALNIRSLNTLKYKVVPKVAKNDTDRIIACGTTWVEIADDIYIAENPIGFEKFDDEYNDYESSYVRKWLLNWFEERKNW